MKKYFLLLLLLTLGLTGFSQNYPLILCGSVQDSSGNGVANHDVNVKLDSIVTGGFFYSYSNTVQTNASGNWCDTIYVPLTIMQGGWTVCTLDCDSITVLDLTGYYAQNSPIGTTITGIDFTQCAPVRNCLSYFTHGSQGSVAGFLDGSVGQTSITSWSWDFGDGNSSTAQNASHTYAANGTYTVCLTITTIGGCTDTYCDQITIAGGTTGGGPFSISGQLIDTSRGPANANICDAEVYLIVYDSAAGSLTAIDTTLLSAPNPNGICSYTFSNVPVGDYLIKGALLPSNPDYATILPTYYQQDLFWSGATTVSVTQGNVFADIWMIHGTNPGGPGFVGGLVTQGANKTHGPGDPMEHVQVMILNMDFTPVQYTYTNANGEYDFSNLAYGTYQIWTEIWGKTVDPIIVTLGPANPSITGQYIEVNSTNILAGVELPSPITGIKVFPNPTEGQGTIQMNLENPGTLSLLIRDLTGRTISSANHVLNSGENTLNFNLDKYAPGLYFLNLEMEGRNEVRKLIVK